MASEDPSPNFFPTSLLVHSSVLEALSPPELIPGTTRGILRGCLVLKGLYGTFGIDLKFNVLPRMGGLMKSIKERSE